MYIRYTRLFSVNLQATYAIISRGSFVIRYEMNRPTDRFILLVISESAIGDRGVADILDVCLQLRDFYDLRNKY